MKIIVFYLTCHLILLECQKKKKNAVTKRTGFVP